QRAPLHSRQARPEETAEAAHLPQRRQPARRARHREPAHRRPRRNPQTRHRRHGSLRRDRGPTNAPAAPPVRRTRGPRHIRLRGPRTAPVRAGGPAAASRDQGGIVSIEDDVVQVSYNLPPAAVAAAVLRLDAARPDPNVTPAQLQRVLYLAQGHYLAATGRRLFDAPVTATHRGPVVAPVQRECAPYTGQVIVHERGYATDPGLP